MTDIYEIDITDIKGEKILSLLETGGQNGRCPIPWATGRTLAVLNDIDFAKRL